jgi:peptide/nickel transport system substrate-binding protein
MRHGSARTGGGRALVGVVVVCLLVAGCSSSSDDDGEATSGSSPAPSSATDFDPNGVVRSAYDLVAAQRSGVTLDPAENTANTADEGLYYAIYGRLLRPTQDGSLVPDLAESATVLDPSTVEIVVRDGITWQDGQPFDAASVKAGLDHILQNGSEGALSPQFTAASAVTVTAPDTVRVTVDDGGAASWYDFLGTWESTIVRPGDDFDKPVGAGPMQVTSYVPNESMELERWDGYWDARSIPIAGIELTNITSEQNDAALAALKGGQVDLAGSDIQLLPAITGDLEPYLQPVDSRLTHFMTCKSEGPLASVAARKAVSRAIDREAVNEAVFEGIGEPATEVWPEGHRFFNPDVAEEMATDPASVEQLLQEAGYPDGFEFDAYVLQAAGMPTLAEVVQAQLADYDITMNIIPSVNYVSDFLETSRPGVGIVPALPGDKLGQWTTDSLSNICDHDDPELNRLREALAKVSLASDEATEIWQEIDRIVAEDALSIPVHFGANVAAYDAGRLSALELWPVGSIVFPDLRGTMVAASS